MPVHHRSAVRGLVALVVSAVAAVLAPATTAQADQLPLSATDQAVADKLAVRSLRSDLGDDLAGLVLDPATGQALWSQTPDEAQIPASNTKVLTAVDALAAFGPTYTFTTRVMTGRTARRAVLVGGGDPSLSARQLGALARAAAAGFLAQGITRVRVQVDDSLFPAPTLAYGWKSAYTIRDVSPVRALVVDQHRRWDTSLDAGAVFARKLEKWGVQVRSVARKVRPDGSAVLAESQGTDLASIVRRMMQDSDNDIAEGLHRLVALQLGYPATWTGAQLAQKDMLARLGITLTTAVYDGSGLSRRDRLTPATLVSALSLALDPARPELLGLQSGAFAVAGVSGTLAPNFRRYVTNPTRCAAGLIQAKTGSLSGVISLSGYARGADGQVKVFSFLLNHVPATLTTRRGVDRLATTVTGCW
ncbi:MAG: D-alanyl-D-alanine carboxypeptidase/D-alanyl-D-alanine-endopeptidase [Sporichthyaceae bacterium]